MQHIWIWGIFKTRFAMLCFGYGSRWEAERAGAQLFVGLGQGTLQRHPKEAGRLKRPQRRLGANKLCWVAVMQIYPYIKPHHNCHFVISCCCC